MHLQTSDVAAPADELARVVSAEIEERRREQQQDQAGQASRAREAVDVFGLV